MTATEFNEDNAFDTILEWSKGRPAWQRDALRLLVSTGSVSGPDLDRLMAVCCDEAAAFDPLEHRHLKPAHLSGSPVSILRIEDPQGINALPGKQRLTFADKGLSIVYGDNGSGKSGYVRILKNACTARDGRTGIRRDIEDTSVAPQAATIGFSSGGVAELFSWTPAVKPNSDLASVSIFDTRSANIHVEKTNAVAYIPQPMKVLEGLAAACDVIKGRLESRVAALRMQTPQAIRAPTLSRHTAAGAFLYNLSARSSLQSLAMLATLSDTEVKRLAQIQSDLAQDASQLAARLGAQRSRLQGYQGQLVKLCAASGAEVFRKRDTLRGELTQKVEAARLASEELFSASPLPAIGSEVWRALWEAARRYADQAARPTNFFPQAVAGSDLCVLCQQPLSEEAVARQETFEAFVQGTTKADETMARAAVVAFDDTYAAAAIRISDLRAIILFIEAEVGEESLAAAVRQAALSAAWRLRALTRGGTEPGSAIEFPASDCEALAAQLNQRIGQLSADGQSPERQKLSQELLELRDRQTLQALLDDVKAEITRRQEVAQLEKALKDVVKRPVTNLNKELSDKLVTNALRGRFAREVEKLRLSRMPVELRKVRDNNAVSFFQVVLVEKPSEPIGEILSEGEHRCIALAAFLAELVTSKRYSGIVFDDPMSSLDHIHRKAVAGRLIEEAAHRQVIVFTHDLTFLYELRREAEAKGQSVHYQTVHRRERPGYIEGELPNKARSALQLANILRSELKAIRADFDRWPDVRRTIVAKGTIEQLREAWDQAIADFVYPVLGRFDNAIKGGSLFKLAVLQESDVATITEARRRLSEDLHAPSQCLNPENVKHGELVAEVKKLEDWAHDIHGRQNAARPPAVSFVGGT